MNQTKTTRDMEREIIFLDENYTNHLEISHLGSPDKGFRIKIEIKGSEGSVSVWSPKGWQLIHHTEDLTDHEKVAEDDLNPNSFFLLNIAEAVLWQGGE